MAGKGARGNEWQKKESSILLVTLADTMKITIFLKDGLQGIQKHTRLPRMADG